MLRGGKGSRGRFEDGREHFGCGWVYFINGGQHCLEVQSCEKSSDPASGPRTVDKWVKEERKPQEAEGALVTRQDKARSEGFPTGEGHMEVDHFKRSSASRRIKDIPPPFSRGGPNRWGGDVRGLGYQWEGTTMVASSITGGGGREGEAKGACSRTGCGKNQSEEREKGHRGVIPACKQKTAASRGPNLHLRKW